MDVMRVEVLVANVHTSEGKLLRGLRVTLPRDEAEQLVANGQAKGVPGKRPTADEPAAAMQLDLDDYGMDVGGGGELGELEVLEHGDEPGEVLDAIAADAEDGT